MYNGAVRQTCCATFEAAQQGKLTALVFLLQLIQAAPVRACSLLL